MDGGEGAAFRFLAGVVRFRAVEAISFPPGLAGNRLRGALGKALVGELERPDLFAPRRTGPGPSGLGDPPRPFVVRAHHLDGRRFATGEAFEFSIHLFEATAREAFLAALGAWPRARLVDADWTWRAVELSPAKESARRVEIRFVTPTALKAEGRLRAPDEFGLLMSRIRDRLSALRALYGDGPLDLDFRAFAGRAARVGTSRVDLRAVEVERHSHSTGQTHPLGGWIGTVEFEGELREFLPYLRAAAFTGVGRYTVWGNGVIEVRPVR